MKNFHDTIIDEQEEFLDDLIDSIKNMRSSAREEELFNSIDDIIDYISYKMKELK